MWVYTMHSCAQMHDVMTSLTGLAHRTSACRKRDIDDMAVVISWASQQNPFDPNGFCLAAKRLPTMVLLIAKLLRQGRRFLWKCTAESTVITWTTSDISSIWCMLQHQLRRYNQRLSPTERAAFFHSLRVYLQVMISKSLGQCQYDPCSLGWEMKNGVLAPVMTDLNPAPEELLEFVQCKCKVTSMSPCSTNLCCCMCSCLVLLLCSHV